MSGDAGRSDAQDRNTGEGPDVPEAANNPLHASVEVTRPLGPDATTVPATIDSATDVLPGRAPIDRRVAPPETTFHTGADVGPYRLTSPLGQGGMGKVYRAEHRESGQEVALKTVRVLREDMLDGLRREVRALARLRHPGVVPVLAEGLHDGAPWYAMPILLGTPLRAWVTPDRPVLETMRLVREILETLAYLHGEGIVHRDLKPENVVITAELDVVLVDFGLSGSFGGTLARETFELAGGVAGTLAYMAPEQGRGELADPRSDLYAAGCILHELLTGRPPFAADSPNQILAMHAFAPPPRPSAIRPGLPAALDELVLRLLAKEPWQRGRADEAAEVLAALGAPGWPTSVPRARPYLHRPTFAGRESEVLELEELVRGEGPGGTFVLLRGESGAGKTRLAMEVARRARAGGRLVLVADCESAGGPLAALRKPLIAVADRCREGGAAESERLLGDRLPVLAPYAPELGDLAQAARCPAPPEISPADARIRLFAALRTTFERLAGRTPVLLVLDDLQWADELVEGWLAFLLRAGLPRAMSILGTLRSEEEADALRSLRAETGVVTLDVGRLGERAVRSIARDMLGASDIAAPLAAYLWRQSEGNPFFVAEYLRTVVAEGFLRRAGGAWEMVAGAETRPLEAMLGDVPASIQELVSRRLSLLGAAARAIAARAAVHGRESAWELIVHGEARSDIEAALSELLAHQILEASERGHVRFVHDKIREVALDALLPAERAELHLRAAVAIETLHGETARAGEAAVHWEEAGDDVRASERHLIAAGQAVELFAGERAEAHYRAFLRLDPTPTVRSVRARATLATKVLKLRGQTEAAMNELRTARKEACELGDRRLELECLHGLGTISLEAGRWDEAEEQLEAARALADELGDRSLLAPVANARGLLRFEQRRLEEAAALHEVAIAIQREQGNDQDAHAVGNLAMVRAAQGRVEEARTLFESALEALERRADRVLAGSVANNYGNYLSDLGRTDEAERTWERALTIAREIGDRRRECLVLGNLGAHRYRSGDLQGMLELCGQAIDRARQIGSRRIEAVVQANMAAACKDLGRLAEAAERLESALEISRAIGDRFMQARISWLVAEIELLQGYREHARTRLDETLVQVRQLGDRMLLQYVLHARGALHRDDGRLDEAVETLAEALEHAGAVGDRPGEVWVARELGLAHLARGDRIRARELLDRALRVLEEVDAHRGLPMVLVAHAELALDEGRLDDARALAGKALAGARELRLLPILVECLCAQGRIALAGGETADAALAEARDLAKQLSAGEASPLGRQVAALARAQAAFGTPVPDAE